MRHITNHVQGSREGAQKHSGSCGDRHVFSTRFNNKPRGGSGSSLLKTMQVNSLEQALLLQRWLYIGPWYVTTWLVAHWSRRQLTGHTRWAGISSKELQSA
jgi:hypothetical protein